MAGITQKSGYIFYYGNMAGYLDRQTAVVDPMFQSAEMSAWIDRQNLTPKWVSGVYERMAAGEVQGEEQTLAPLKNVRIWQMKAGVDWEKKFLGYNELVKMAAEPRQRDYTAVYDGQLGTNDLEEIWNRFRFGEISEVAEHPLSISDVVELYDESGSVYFYIDRTNFRPIEFA